MDSDHSIEEMQRHQQELNVWLGTELAKSVVDNFDYLVVLRDGTRIRYNVAVYEPGSKFITLRYEEAVGSDETQAMFSKKIGYPCPRGIQIALSDVMFVADAPDGS